VLCDATAIVGVMKQTNTSTGELREATIAFGKESVQSEPDTFGFGGPVMMARCAMPSMSMAAAPHFAMKSMAPTSMAMPRMASFGA